MRIWLRQVAPIGFKGSGLFDDSKEYSFYYKKDPKKRKVIVLGNTAIQTVSVFTFTPKEYKAFERGKLGITPPGCCNAVGKPSKECYSMIHQGDIKSLKHLKLLIWMAEKTD